MNKIKIDLGELSNSCFVVMPFSPFFQTEYEKIIQPALAELNIKCIRGDEIYTKQRIVDDIWVSIRKCRFILAELTGRNPNVLYEIGLAHAIGKPVVIITRNSDDVPFDLKALRYLCYNVDEPFWGENLKVGIQILVRKIIENPDIEKYLDGISDLNETKFPDIVKLSVLENTHIGSSSNVEGTWIGGFHDIYHGEKREVKVTLQITQVEDQLFGASINSYIKAGKQTVVQEIMNGTVKGDYIQLHGVNYTYVERGNESSYVLDSYDLRLVSDDKSLIGSIISENSVGYKLKTKLEFHRT